LRLAAESGVQIQGSYTQQTSYLDLKEGMFVGQAPSHPNYITGIPAETTSKIQHINFYNDLEHIKLNREMRRQLLDAFLQYISFHVTDFKELRSLSILQEVLN
jgi:DNA repair protein RecO (recombination protein O)